MRLNRSKKSGIVITGINEWKGRMPLRREEIIHCHASGNRTIKHYLRSKWMTSPEMRWVHYKWSWRHDFLIAEQTAVTRQCGSHYTVSLCTLQIREWILAVRQRGPLKECIYIIACHASYSFLTSSTGIIILVIRQVELQYTSL